MKLHLATDHGMMVITLDHNECHCTGHLAGHAAQSVAIDPSRPELVYCGTFGSGLWCSDDAGRNWHMAGEGISHSKIFSVAVSPTERVKGKGVVYAGTEPSSLFRSEDVGKTWRECTGLTDLPSSSEWSFPPRPETHHARWIHADPHRLGRLFVAIEAGALVRSPDSGKTWIDRVPTGPIDTHHLVTHSAAPDRLYSAAGDGYFESLDAGDTWQRIEDGMRRNYVWSVAVDGGDPDTRIVATAASPRQSHYQPDAVSFLYRRTAETPWQVVRDGLPNPAGRRTAVLVAHPDESGSFFAAWENDLFHSTDGGASWQQLDVPWPEGFAVGEPRGLAVAPHIVA